MKQIITIFIIITIFNSPSYAQTAIDSLENRLISSEGKDRVDVLNALADAYYSFAPVKSIIYGKDALSLSEKIKYKFGEAQALNYIGMGYDFLGDYDTALNYYMRGLRTFENLDEYGYSSMLNNIGTLYSEMGDYQKALDYYEESRKSFADDDYYSMGVYLNNIAEVYGIMGDNEKSLELYKESKDYYEKAKDKSGIATALNNIADVYCFLEDYDEANKAGLESLKIFEEIDDQYGVSYALLTLGEINHKLKIYRKALHYLEKAKTLTRLIGNATLEKTAYEDLYKVYQAMGNLEKSFDSYRMYRSLQDSLFSQESQNEVARMQLLYETEKKQKQIELLQKSSKERKAQRNALIISSLALLTTAVVLYRSNRFKNKLNSELDKQNRELSRLNKEFIQASTEVKSLSNLLPICAHCKKIRDDKGYWKQVEDYLSERSIADFSHGICPECSETYYGDFLKKKKD